MHGHQNVHTSHDPPADPTFRCDGCRVGLPIELIATVAAGYVYCQTCSVPDRLPTPTRVDFSPLNPERLPSCARCGDAQIWLVEDPVFGAEVEVCRDCYHEHGDPAQKRTVTTDFATTHAVDEG